MPTAAEMVAAAKAKVEHLGVDEAAREVEEGATLVDIREPGERQKDGYIDGAVEAPRGMIEMWADPSSPSHRAEFDPAKRIVVHCSSGGRSALAAATLQDLGYRNVAHLDGGIKAWKEAGRPVRQD